MTRWLFSGIAPHPPHPTLASVGGLPSAPLASWRHTGLLAVVQPLWRSGKLYARLCAPAGLGGRVAAGCGRESALRLRLKSDERSARYFDGAFELNYEIVLSDCLRLDLKMRNTGPRRFAVTTGFHPYFQVKDLLSATVRTPDETIRCVPEMDGGRPLADGRYVLGDGIREIALTTRGNRKLVVWNSGEIPTDGLLPGEWRRFVCVEPAIVPRREGIWLDPGREYALGLTIQASARGM